MRNWTYSEHDGKHIINDDQGVLVAMVVDAKTAELIIRQHEEAVKVSERIINLPDGLEPMSEEDLKTIWNKADDARGEEAHMSNDVFDLVNALDAAYTQIDSLQQQVAQLRFGRDGFKDHRNELVIANTSPDWQRGTGQ
ncbi:hypothetical protein [Paenibacillus polymyxa]|uniref:Uncharacterized protein n=1 Tax=Paenibacillus polymyxa (strain SC2) TaxID=886882 RepID=E3EL18_PAEPS|nr:hypothetical protein [Paenibacillus polymyxa]ADO59580.1 hypothetical protein PPSC2_27200 [Paenibacillus polymyxa SC2]WPQ59589.1 hypothetical protein SKN87_28405 [Paenibacillus polymyxa]